MSMAICKKLVVFEKMSVTLKESPGILIKNQNLF